jgi:archaemetzincin
MPYIYISLEMFSDSNGYIYMSHKIIRALILLLLFVLVSETSSYSGMRPVIAIQPLGDVKNEIIDAARAGIEKLYNVDVIVLRPVDLPREAFYKPRKRYRAEIILDFLDQNRDTKIMKIIGITEKDISTTKGSVYDWGIFGLGTIGGRSCTVSIFRLHQGNASEKKFYERFVKVVNHELGHTFGLEHCPERGCLMDDAKGTVATVDNENGAFCTQCRKTLADILK